MEPTFEIKEEKIEEGYGKFVISPLEQGYGFTLGVALRRVLLNSLPGSAITQVKVAGVKHQFSSLKGMKEDIVDFLLNLKKVRVKYGGDKPLKLTLSIKGAGEVKAGDIKTPATAQIVNPKLVLANLAKGSHLEVDMEVETGVGYSIADERTSGKIGVIPMDALFSPVSRVNYKVEETRVGRVTNYDKLTLEIWTDKSSSPKDALIESAKILSLYFNQIFSPKKVKRQINTEVADSLGSTGKLSVEEIGLPTRVANALARAGFDTVEKLVEAPKENLIKIRNLGEKSLKIVKVALLEKGVNLRNA